MKNWGTWTEFFYIYNPNVHSVLSADLLVNAGGTILDLQELGGLLEGI